MVPGTGIEPARELPHKILSLARLPVPPPGHRSCPCARADALVEGSIGDSGGGVGWEVPGRKIPRGGRKVSRREGGPQGWGGLAG